MLTPETRLSSSSTVLGFLSECEDLTDTALELGAESTSSSSDACRNPADGSSFTEVQDPLGAMPAESGGEAEPDFEEEIDRLAQALSAKFEELTLIHQLSERLRIDEDSDEICRSLLAELSPCLSAQTIAMELFADEDLQKPAKWFCEGKSRDPEWLAHLAEFAAQNSETFASDSSSPRRLAIVNNPVRNDLAEVRAVVVSIERDSFMLGRMIVIRSREETEFGTVEADLLKSTSMMLGVHLINQRRYLELQQMCEATIQSLVSALDAKDAYTCGHSSRVADLAVALAQRLGFDEEGISRIRMAGILHDIGKIGVEDSVLRKPGHLTDEEFEQIKLHPVLGFDILQGIRQFRPILPAVRHHHEAWDGSGYPDGLAGDSIPRDAQVLAVADAFDAMTSDRPYRAGMPLEEVVSIFKTGRGVQWAADVVDALLSCPELMSAYTLREKSAPQQERSEKLSDQRRQNLRTILSIDSTSAGFCTK